MCVCVYMYGYTAHVCNVYAMQELSLSEIGMIITLYFTILMAFFIKISDLFFYMLMF